METSLILIGIGFIVCVAVVAAVLFMPTRPGKGERDKTWKSPCPTDDDLFFDPSFSSLSCNIYNNDDLF